LTKVFTMELTGNDLCCELDLPASDYQLLDALEQLAMEPGDLPGWDILGCHENYSIVPLLSHSDSIYEINALSRQLAGLDDWQRTAFEGLLAMELRKRDGDISIGKLRELAANTDCCHVVPEAMNDSQLGRFYAENGFLPETEKMPDEIFELLDFEMLGRKARMGENGIFIERGGDCPGGYVVRHSDMEHTISPAGPPQKPEYIFRLSLSPYPFNENNCRWKDVLLHMPATEGELFAALVALEAPSWEEVVFHTVDSALPGFPDDSECLENIGQINELARTVKKLDEAGQLMKYKAVLDAVECSDLDAAMELADRLEEYQFSPGLRSADDVARTELKVLMDDSSMEQILPHLNLYSYGADLVRRHNGEITPYGLVERQDGQPLQEMEQPSQGGMEMR